MTNQDKTAEQLRACPFCKRTDTLILLWASEQEGKEWDDSNDDCVRVICDASTDGGKGGCGSSSGFRKTIEEAKTLWNTRADSGEAVAIHVNATEEDGTILYVHPPIAKAGDTLFTHPRATAEDVRDAEMDCLGCDSLGCAKCFQRAVSETTEAMDAARWRQFVEMIDPDKVYGGFTVYYAMEKGTDQLCYFDCVTEIVDASMDLAMREINDGKS